MERIECEGGVVLVEDDALLRDLLGRMLGGRFGTKSVTSFGAGRPALAHCLKKTPGLLITDLRLPDMDGRDVIRQLRVREPELRVIVLTGQADGVLPAELIALGVAGFIDKSTPLAHLEAAVEQVLAGGLYYAAKVRPTASRLVASASEGRASGAGSAVLSPREREVARLVTAGLSSKEIAMRLEISPRTVEKHRLEIMAKLKLRSMADLIRWCLREGLE